MPKHDELVESRLHGIAAIIAAIPRSLWFTVIGLLLSFIGTALFLHRDAIPSFVDSVLTFTQYCLDVALGLVVLRIAFVIYTKWHGVHMMSIERSQAKARLNNTVLKNDLLVTKTRERDLYPSLVNAARANGLNVEMEGLKITNYLSNLHTILPGDTHVSQIAQASLPTMIRYEDIKHQIPQGHNVVGVADSGLITKEDRHIGACVWIIGLSGSGKTSTTSLRLEERADCGHNFLGVDPHWFKDDSLSNAVVGFSERFLLPMARDTTETLLVLQTFLKEFQNRKAGKVAKPFQKITLVVDEMGSLNDPQCDEEEEVLKLLKTIVRICGQEARNFNMGGIFISQQATGLFWIGDVALLIIVHKLLKENQMKLATQSDDKKLFSEMRLWPKGRSYVYGMGLEEGEGCLVVQQPYFEKPSLGQWSYPTTVNLLEDDHVSTTQLSDSELVRIARDQLIENGDDPTLRAIGAITNFGKDKVARLLKELE
jgi:hypothetical protein